MAGRGGAERCGRVAAGRRLERRDRARAAFDGWVELCAAGERLRRARGVDLSPDGIGLELRPPHPDALRSLVTEFALPGISLPLAIETAVAWTDAAGARLGLRFRGLDPGLGALIEQFVAERLSAPAGPRDA